MTIKHLHIVTLDTPWPVSYGGVVDLYYKLQALHKQGIVIHLHCFCKEEIPHFELNKFCAEVNYYKRNNPFSTTLPYMVQTRASKKLIENLEKDNYPILLEGIHCTYPLFTNKLQNRKVIVRLHNVEYEYYKHLAKNEKNPVKKIFFLRESKLLYKYEKKLATIANYLTVSKADVELYKAEFGAIQIQFLPVFIEEKKRSISTEQVSYCLYHGNLSINENVKAVEWLLYNVFNKIEIPFVVAGKNPSTALINKVHKNPIACIVDNPSSSELDDLLQKAQINILPSFNATGVKLKLINALYNGKHCITNAAGVAGSGLQSICHIANTPIQIIEKTQELFKTEITEKEIVERELVLKSLYNNEANAERLIRLIYH
jgi:glycosyltransferase involved in cell wall biosynthesis